ncbi:MAG: DUF962 domain-containing protein [Alphaproteobacteria bacterium]
MSQRIRIYREFWPYYLREHARPGTRAIHYFGTGLVLSCAALAIMSGQWAWLFILPLAGYGPAWVAHFFVEKNKPATFRYPLWSLVSDFRMFFIWIAGGMPRELSKAGLDCKRPT